MKNDNLNKNEKNNKNSHVDLNNIDLNNIDVKSLSEKEYMEVAARAMGYSSYAEVLKAERKDQIRR